MQTLDFYEISQLHLHVSLDGELFARINVNVVDSSDQIKSKVRKYIRNILFQIKICEQV
jgi:hypothetical protein